MISPLESNFLLPNASLLVALCVFLLVVGVAVGALVWLVVSLSRRDTATDR